MVKLYNWLTNWAVLEKLQKPVFIIFLNMSLKIKKRKTETGLSLKRKCQFMKKKNLIKYSRQFGEWHDNNDKVVGLNKGSLATHSFSF